METGFFFLLPQVGGFKILNALYLDYSTSLLYFYWKFQYFPSFLSLYCFALLPSFTIIFLSLYCFSLLPSFMIIYIFNCPKQELPLSYAYFQLFFSQMTPLNIQQVSQFYIHNLKLHMSINTKNIWSTKALIGVKKGHK